MNRVKVLHLRDTDRVCGPGKTIIEMANHIDKSRFDLHVASFERRKGEGNQYIDAVKNRGHTAFSIPMRGRFDRSVLKNLARIINENGYSILHTHDGRTDIIGRLVANSCGVRLLSTCHGWIRNSVKARLVAEIQKRALRRFQYIVAVSPLIKSELVKCGIDKRRIDVIFNAIVTKNYKRADWPYGEFTGSLAIPENKTLIGYVGRLSIEKGQREFLHGAAPVLAEHREMHVVFVGDGPDEDLLKKLARDLGISERVTFAGHMSDVRSAYRDLNLLVLTSRTEGFPNVVLEGMSMEVPVLASDVGGTSVLVQDGKTGRLIEANSEEAITEALRWFAQNSSLAQACAQRAYSLVNSKFEFGERCRKVEMIYDRLLGESAP